jgi:DNA-binding GntR family transcriptional regulator
MNPGKTEKSEGNYPLSNIRPLEKIDRSSLRDLVLTSIRNAIIIGKLKASDKISEVELSEQLGVSRTPVREAIRTLELHGFIEVHPKNGTYISSFDSDELQDGLHVRVALEDLALKQALERMNSRDWQRHCDRLESLIERMYAAADELDPVEDIELDMEFHTLMMDAAQNRILSRSWKLSGASNFIWSLEHVLYPHTKNELREHAKRHVSLLEVLRDRKSEECIAALRHHILRKINDIQFGETKEVV